MTQAQWGSLGSGSECRAVWGMGGLTIAEGLACVPPAIILSESWEPPGGRAGSRGVCGGVALAHSRLRRWRRELLNPVCIHFPRFIAGWLMGHVPMWALCPSLHNSRGRARPSRSTEKTLGAGERRAWRGDSCLEAWNRRRARSRAGRCGWSKCGKSVWKPPGPHTL